MGTTKQNQQNEESEKKSDEVILHKERIAGHLAYAIIIGSLGIIGIALVIDYFDPTRGMVSIVYPIFSGWVGVVIGYYFGTAPAEKTAQLAQEKAQASEEKSGKIKVQAQKVAETISKKDIQTLAPQDTSEIMREIEFLKQLAS